MGRSKWVAKQIAKEHNISKSGNVLDVSEEVQTERKRILRLMGVSEDIPEEVLEMEDPFPFHVVGWRSWDNEWEEGDNEKYVSLRNAPRITHGDTVTYLVWLSRKGKDELESHTEWVVEQNVMSDSRIRIPKDAMLEGDIHYKVELYIHKEGTPDTNIPNEQSSVDDFQ